MSQPWPMVPLSELAKPVIRPIQVVPGRAYRTIGVKWWKKREENERAWKVAATDILANGCNLDIKNPNAKQDFEHQPREKLADDILQKELRIAEIMQEIKQLLGRRP